MRFWVLVFLVVGLVAFTPRAKAQTPITSPNLITNPTFVGTTGWTTTGGVGGNGPTHPAAPANGAGYTFTYSQGTIAQTYAINQALANVGAGVQIAGFDYGFKYRFGCANSIGGYCENPAGLQDTLNATSTITSNTGATLYTRYYALGANAPAPYSATFSSVDTQQRFSAALPVENLGNFRISFTGMDAGFWGGNYGPTIKDVYSKAVYTVDPCAGNPAYSPSCSGYNTVTTSPNLLTGITGPQAYAINQALSNAGAGAMIHGFNYGYDYSVAGRTCSFLDLFGFCLTGWQYSDAGVATVITDSNNSTIYSSSNTHNGGDNGTFGTYSKQFRFGTSRQITTLGGFGMAPWTSGNASITNMYSNAVYTADPCLDPLSSPSCSGYAAAYFTQQCTANPLYNSACPGYAQAYFTQQCTVNAMFDPACPGYASAYLTYQCSINPLFSTTCVGYAQAYHDQQCSINPLHSTTCTGYASAYHNQQCTANPLYSTTCTGYAEAYKAQQCSLDGLYDRTCPNYADAYARKYVIGIPSSGTISYGPADSRCTVGCDTSNTLNTNAGPATSGYSGPGATNVSTTQPVTSISNSGQISTGVAVTNDSNVNAVIATPKMDGPAASTGNSPVASSINSPGPAASGSSTQTANAGPATRQEQKSEDKRDDAPKGTGSNNSPQTTNTAQASSDKPAAPTARQELQARREAAAKTEAVEKGKNLANEMGKASDMESQKQVQNVVIQAMGFTPGFDTYGKAMLPDVAGYKPYSVYNNQKTIDNRANLRMFGGTDRLHNEMIDAQYNRGK